MPEAARNGAKYLRDPSRLAALQELNIIGSAPEEAFDAIARLASCLFRVELAAIHLVDDESLWVKASSDGGWAGEIFLGQSFCEHTICRGDLLLVPDLTRDRRFSNSHLVNGPSPMRFYAGMPLTTHEGHHVGTLCLLDSRANIRTRFDEHELSLFRELANVTIRTMELRAAHDEAQHNFLRALEEDAVTGLMSHSGLLLELNQSMNENGRERVVAMVTIRLSGTAELRSGYGAHVFHQVLQEVAERLRSAARPGTLLARLDDQRFVIARVFPGESEQGNHSRIDRWAELAAEDLLDVFNASFEAEDEDFFVGACAGIARCLNGEIDINTVLEQAKQAAESASRNGHEGQAVEWAQSDLSSVHRHRVSMKRRLRAAISNQDLAVVYQPVVNLQSGEEVVGAEALVRWPQEEGAPIGPNLFIPLAEDLGLINQLGTWVFEQACLALRYWQDRVDRSLWVSVNVSPLQLHDRDLPRQLKEIATQAGVEPSRIKLEITESALIERLDEVSVLLNQLVKEGFSLALDDFGTGHSSLIRLIHLPFQVLKVDRAFVSDSPDGPGAAVVASLSGLATTLSLETVGEGVETEAQARFLRSHGYGLGQGYLYSRPVSREAFLDCLGLSQSAGP